MNIFNNIIKKWGAKKALVKEELMRGNNVRISALKQEAKLLLDEADFLSKQNERLNEDYLKIIGKVNKNK